MSDQNEQTGITFAVPPHLSISGDSLAESLLLPLRLMDLEKVGASLKSVPPEDVAEFVFGMVAQAVALIAGDLVDKYVPTDDPPPATAEVRPPDVTLQ